jgi:NAD-dependent DNA ligase
MADSFQRQIAKYANDMKRCLGALLGIAQGMVCDGQLNDGEIHFLNDWLTANDEICVGWPGDIIHQRIKCVLADGVITEAERTYLLDTLHELIGGTAETLTAPNHVTQFAFDDVPVCEFHGMRFCLTGDFVYGPRDLCEREIENRGGIPANSVTKALRYLVIGDRGSVEWKHGSFGTKVEKAQEYKRKGSPILIVREERWVSSLNVMT